jgi:hypothetical protein
MMPIFEVNIEFSGNAKFRIEEEDAVKASDACREFFEKGFETSKKIPESVTEDSDNRDSDFVIDATESEVLVGCVSTRRFTGESERKEALKKIFETYGTEDVEKIFADASSARVGTAHAEFPVAAGTYCGKCGKLEDFTGDPIYHPEQWL